MRATRAPRSDRTAISSVPGKFALPTLPCRRNRTTFPLQRPFQQVTFRLMQPPNVECPATDRSAEPQLRSHRFYSAAPETLSRIPLRKRGNVLGYHRVWNGARRLLREGAIAVATSSLGMAGCSLPALAVEPGEVGPPPAAV